MHFGPQILDKYILKETSGPSPCLPSSKAETTWQKWVVKKNWSLYGSREAESKGNDVIRSQGPDTVCKVTFSWLTQMPRCVLLDNTQANWDAASHLRIIKNAFLTHTGRFKEILELFTMIVLCITQNIHSVLFLVWEVEIHIPRKK